MNQTANGNNRNDHRQFAIRVIGATNDVARVEKDLAGVFGPFWSEGSLTITAHSDGATYRTSHPTSPAALEEVFSAHPGLIFLMSVLTTKNRLHWEFVTAYGYHAESTLARYEPNSNIPFEETQLSSKIFGRYLSPATRPTPAQVMAEFGAKTEKLLEKRKATQKAAAAKALADTQKPNGSP